MYGEGISKLGELVNNLDGVKANIVEKSGSWYTYDSQRVGQGRENAKAYMRDNKQAAEALEREIRANAGLIATRMLGRQRRRRRRGRGCGRCGTVQCSRPR